MNFTNLIVWCANIIMALTAIHNIDSIQRTVWAAQAKIIYESRTETWGSPNFLTNEIASKKNRAKSSRDHSF